MSISRQFLLLLGLLTFVIAGCSSSSKDKKSTEKAPAEELYLRAEGEMKNENYIQAIDLFNELKTKFPYSKFARESELRIGDAYFSQESYAEAAATYQGFIQLYPKDKKVDYALYQKGLCHTRNSPSTISRDLTKSLEAISTFESLIAKHPSSSYVAKARKEKIEMRKRLAAKEHYVGNFYFIRDHFLSASLRYDRILKEFSGLGFDEIALFRSGVSYLNIQQNGKAKERLTELIKRFPNHPLTENAKDKLNEIN